MTQAVQLKITSDVALPDEILIGKDILELVSGAMYVNPLNLYREYIQNATDSIDQLEAPEQGGIEVFIDPAERVICIRDTGVGLSNRRFAKTMTAVGGSRKRAIPGSRGFRGVGRFSGLGYCRSLSFRSKSAADKKVIEVTWDCVKFKKILRDSTYEGDLSDVIREVSSVSSSPALSEESFFEVRLDGVVRLKNDALLNEQLVSHYLSQVAPVPFNPAFRVAKDIGEWLEKHGIASGYQLKISDVSLKEREVRDIYRPYSDTFSGASGQIDKINSIQFLELPGIDGGVAAIGWIADTAYLGALPPSSLLSGIRLRVGNIQVGDSSIVAEEFPESRFNSWSIGELHILSKKILPNGRRDNFEENTHYDDLLGQLQPHLRNIAQVCRQKSSRRQWTARFQSKVEGVSQDIRLLEAGSINKRRSAAKLAEAKKGVLGLEELISSSKYDWVADLAEDLAPLKQRISKFESNSDDEGLDPLARVPYQKRLAFQEILELVYEVSANKEVGNMMVDRVVRRIASKYKG